LSVAAKSGFRYVVLTAKHHEGYALWPSQIVSRGSIMNGRDLVAPFVDACRKNDLKVGLYYSVPDWYI
jgi:alpha-L-fucosidase